MMAINPIKPDTIQQLCCPLGKPSRDGGYETLQTPAVKPGEMTFDLIKESFPLAKYVSPSQNKTNEPLLAYESVILEKLAESFFIVRQTLPVDVYDVVHQLALATYMHALPNAIDAVYEAVDRELLTTNEARIDFRLIFRDESATTVAIEITDNGVGIQPSKMQSFERGWFNSSKSRGGRTLGQDGSGLSELVRICSDIARLEITSSPRGEPSRACRFVAEPAKHSTGTVVVGPRLSVIELDAAPHGTALTLTFYPSCSVIQQLRAAYQRGTRGTAPADDLKEAF